MRLGVVSSPLSRKLGACSSLSSGFGRTSNLRAGSMAIHFVTEIHAVSETVAMMLPPRQLHMEYQLGGQNGLEVGICSS